MKNSQFKNIAILTRSPNDKISKAIIGLYNYLLSDNYIIHCDANASVALSNANITIKQSVSHEFIGKNCDVAIIVGGDGSILYAANTLVNYNIPIIGINRGKLGFLTDLAGKDFTTQLGKILAGEYKQTKLFVLDLQINNKKYLALNDIVFNSGSITRMIEYNLYLNNNLIYNQRSDGLIIATPTGSTAYSLSAGGPIICPELNVLALVPMFPHNLTARPIVINANNTIKLTLTLTHNQEAGISCDGKQLIKINEQDEVIITKSKLSLNLLHPINYDYYATLRNKLNWHI